MDSSFIITLDIDWAPDWMIRNAAAVLRNAGVKATWFATHASNATEEIQADPLFEIGIHPNFEPGSTHGSTPQEVMTHLRSLFPNAISCRSHSLGQSERILQMQCEEFGIRIDCSIHLPNCTHISPHKLSYSPKGRKLLRIPHFFQDNSYLCQSLPVSFDSIDTRTAGLKVFNFHPVHIALNTNSMQSYFAFQKAKDLRTVRSCDIDEFRNAKEGIGTLFAKVVAEAKKQEQQHLIKDFLNADY